MLTVGFDAGLADFPPLLYWEQDSNFWIARCGTSGHLFPGRYTLEESIHITLSFSHDKGPITSWDFGTVARSVLSNEQLLNPRVERSN